MRLKRTFRRGFDAAASAAGGAGVARRQEGGALLGGARRAARPRRSYGLSDRDEYAR